MKIAYLVDEFPSVSQTFVMNQITGMIDRGNSVCIFAEGHLSADKIHSQYEKYRLLEKTYYNIIPKNKLLRICKALWYVVKYLPQNFSAVSRSLNIFRYGGKAASLNLLFLIVPFIEKGPFDIIHCQFGTLGLKGLYLKQTGVVKCKMITSIRGFDITMFLQKNPGAYDELFQIGDLFLPVCETFSLRLIKEGCDKNKIVIHHSGIDCSRIQYKERKRSENEPTKVVTVARLVEKKGVTFAIKAIASLIGLGINISYKVIGDGVLRGDLERLIKMLGVEAQIELLGWRTHEETLLLMQEAHVMIAPSITTSENDQEGIPNALKEAMASGMPVISTRHSGIPELVQDGISGFLVPERDIGSLADSLAYLISHPEICNEMGKAGRIQVEQKFDAHQLNNRLEELYLKLLHEEKQ